MQRKIRPFHESKFGCRELRALRGTVFRFANRLYLPILRDGGGCLFCFVRLNSFQRRITALSVVILTLNLRPPPSTHDLLLFEHRIRALTGTRARACVLLFFCPLQVTCHNVKLLPLGKIQMMFGTIRLYGFMSHHRPLP